MTSVVFDKGALRGVSVFAPHAGLISRFFGAEGLQSQSVKNSPLVLEQVVVSPSLVVPLGVPNSRRHGDYIGGKEPNVIKVTYVNLHLYIISLIKGVKGGTNYYIIIIYKNRGEYFIKNESVSRVFDQGIQFHF